MAAPPAAPARLTTRPLGRTPLHVSPLGLAGMSVPTGAPSTGPALTAADVERAFHELGVNTFLVHFMMKEMCEGVRRLVRAGHRDELVLISEVGLPFAGSVRRGLEKHLRVVEVDHLDAWLLGWVRLRYYTRESVWSELVRLREAGKVRAIGYSSHDRPLAAALAAELDPDVLMIRYNAAHRGAEREVFAPLEQRGSRPGIIAYTATRWGMLLKPLPGRAFPEGMTAPECYRFSLGHPAVDMAWCAARSWSELAADVAGVLEGPLGERRVEEIRAFGDAVHATARGGRRWMFGRNAG